MILTAKFFNFSCDCLNHAFDISIHVFIGKVQEHNFIVFDEFLAGRISLPGFLTAMTFAIEFNSQTHFGIIEIPSCSL